MAPSPPPKEKEKGSENLLAGTVQLLTLKNPTSNQMEVDPPNSVGSTRAALFTKEPFTHKKGKRARAPTPEEEEEEEEEVEVLVNPTSKIQILVKAHVENWKQFKLSELAKDQLAMKLYLRQAQGTQKSLQKLISKEEAEGYVDNWNPWDQYKKSFPAPVKTPGNPYKKKKSHYNNKGKWAHVARVAEALTGVYDSLPGGSK